MDGEKIRITKEDLRAPEVEEILEKEAALLGNVEYLHRKEKPKSRFFLTSWFYLLLAGILGAFFAWMLIEPHFDDAIRITGKIDEIKGELESPDYKGKIYDVIIAGNEVYLLDETLYSGEDGQGEKVTSFSNLKVGQNAYVACEPASGDMLLAGGIRISPDAFPPMGREGLKAIEAKSTLFAFLMFPLLGALIGLAIACADGILSRAWLKALQSGIIGLLIGGLGGIISAIIGGLIYAVTSVAMSGMQLDPWQSAPAFMLQVARRTVSWCILGMTMGLGQGIAIKSKKMVLNGFLGGALGGLLGGLFFDPIDIIFLSRGVFDPFRTADVSRLAGFLLTGASVGFMIGLVEQLSKDAWLVMTKGPITGKQFIIYKDVTRIGSSPAGEIYLFKDPEIDPEHALIMKIHDGYLIHDNHSSQGVFVNKRKIRERRLNDGDQIQIGKAEFIFSLKQRRA